MGLREIKQFNLAMLRKQGRRLMTNTDSLCATVLKALFDYLGLDRIRMERTDLVPIQLDENFAVGWASLWPAWNRNNSASNHLQSPTAQF
jgi:hypothetical protein